MNYDISGPGADLVELKVYQYSHYVPGEGKQVHSEQGKADGYFEMEFTDGYYFSICFKSLDSETKDLSFMIN